MTEFGSNLDQVGRSTSADPAAVRASLDRLAQAGERHLRNCGVVAGDRTRSTALALYDRQLGLHDRLLTADEFLQGGLAGGFEAAALEDAARFLARAESSGLDRIEPPPTASQSGSRWRYAGAAVAVIALLAAIWFMRGTENREGTQPPLAAGLPDDAAMKRSDATVRDRSGARDPLPESQAQRTASPPSTGEQTALPDRTRLADAQADAANSGAATRAKPSQASSSTSGGPSDGATPDDGNSPDESGDTPSRAASNAPGGQNEALGAQRESARNMSGANAPENNASGAMQTAAANGGKRQASARSGSDAAAQRQEGQQGSSGASPSAQRSSQGAKQSGAQGESSNPGASSNTSQGKGQGVSRDAIKKSRGVASMILGVPVPDEVRGLPNPGLVRTLQKKTAPKTQTVAAVDAQDRGARAGPIGNVEHPSLRPWMKDLVRDYFSQDSGNEGQQ